MVSPTPTPIPGVLPALQRGLAGRYQLEEEIGRGGMAVVFRARDLRHHRQVALKVLHAKLLGTQGAQRFVREIRLVAGFIHPHILPLYDSGEIPGAGAEPGLLYFVMPFVVGESLRARLQREARLPLDQAMRLAREVAGALDYAHRRNVVHRDVKPENILLHEGSALVTDFGVARVMREAGQGPDLVTEPGLAVGTPAYMSPEQASGERELDGRSDQYSLGCVLYEMLAGRPPFAGPARAVMARHVSEPPPPLRPLRPEVPLAIEQVVFRALAKDPAERFPTVAAFGDALATPLAGLTPDVLPDRTRDLTCTIAVLPFANSSADPENEYLSDGLTDELITALAQVPGLRVSSRSSVFALKGTRHDARAIGALLGAELILEGSIRRIGGRLRITAQLTDTGAGRLVWSEGYDREADDFLAIQEEIARTIVRTIRGGPLGPARDFTPRRYTENPKAYALYLKGRYCWNQRTPAGTHTPPSPGSGSSTIGTGIWRAITTGGRSS